MKVLVTGSTGLIGQAVSNELRRRHDVLTASRRAQSDIRLDLSLRADMQALELPSIDALVHCAGIVDEDFQADKESAFKMAYSGANELAQRAVRSGAKKLIYISSAHVYGSLCGAIDEGSAVDPRSDYALAHFLTEQIFRRNLPEDGSGFALRPCAVFGDLEDHESFRRWSLIPFAFPRSAIENKKIVIRSTGEQRRNFVGTRDIARLVANLIEGNSVSGWRVVNPIGEFDASVLEFAQLCANISRDITGTTCTVTRCESSEATDGEDFKFQSRAEQQIGLQSIASFVRDLMSQIKETNANG